MIDEDAVAGAVPAAAREQGRVCLRLYVAGSTPNSQRAMANLDSALTECADERAFKIEYVDVLVESQRAAADSVIVTPTLVAFGKKSRLVVIGDLGNSAKLRDFLKAAAHFG